MIKVVGMTGLAATEMIVMIATLSARESAWKRTDVRRNAVNRNVVSALSTRNDVRRNGGSANV